jgi:hypothetical protein
LSKRKVDARHWSSIFVSSVSPCTL